jgi:2-polyprenyl-6-methoxyphenol hydroxylase-like FAD-dependent oxidoreductase
VSEITARCCIVGGGPAGMMLGFLLARAGVDVVVLEKHADFLRDFRGDTIHPSTLEVMHELGLLDEFLALPHTRAHTLGGAFGAEQFTFVDFSHLPTRCKFIALMPQWDFLNFLSDHGKRYPNFRLLMNTEAADLIEQGGRVAGVRATAPDGPVEVRANLVVACDGRHSTLRERAGMKVDDIGAPMDVLWFRLSHKAGDSDQSMGRFEAGRLVVLIDRGDYWQCAYVIRKGAFARVREAGLGAFRAGLAASVPMFADRVVELADWDQIKLLTVAVDRLATWHRPGLLCLGDAAHAMSPIGGVGVNLAVQDAVAAANLLWEPLRRGAPTNDDLARVQRRRELPARVTQRIQVVLQDKVVNRALQASGEMKVPLAIRLMARFPLLRRIPARLLGLGVRPEHVKVPEAELRSS